ncbi:putative N-acetyltransferase YoaA [Madurella mycetomatis]|uniref:Putative N-acetyltransferase YoaA n=1 Tax=Madurella mycetomatis TaxID=100816 RepID=A0A175VYC4_9PEZI|nr:putative N-acetyltransferase YoaA [Madurella mycetomatis]KXX75744.1 putative N-acetyltransferase YoaA [Madurella mycetomatis]
MPLGPFATKSDFVSQFLVKWPREVPGWITLAVIDKTRPPSAEDDEGELAGMMSYLRTSTTHLSTEIGGIVVLPPYHRTHVTTNAVGLMLQFALGSVQNGGMGLRRVEWQTSTMNIASIRVAERMGFRREAVLRWHFVFPQGTKNNKIGNGRPLPPGSPDGDLGRDTVVLGLCWDDWEQEAREKVEEAMARTK